MKSGPEGAAAGGTTPDGRDGLGHELGQGGDEAGGPLARGEGAPDEGGPHHSPLALIAVILLMLAVAYAALAQVAGRSGQVPPLVEAAGTGDSTLR